MTLPSGNRTSRTLIVILLIAFGLRLALFFLHTGPIENEGAGYTRIAESLYFRHNYSGIAENPDLASPPGFPMLIAATAFVTRNFVIAARVVSLLSGLSLVWSLYLLASRIYGPKTGLLAALVAAIHPFLATLSAATYNESPYFAFLFFGLYWAVRMFDPVPSKAWFWTAFFLGCSFLIRPESLPIPLLVGLLVFASHGRNAWRKAVLDSARMLSVFALFVIPYGLFLRAHTGHFQLEARNLVNYTIGNRILDGSSALEATRGLGENLEFKGPLLHTNIYASYSPYPAGFKEVVRYFVRMALFNRFWLYSDVFPAFAFGAPLLWCLVFLGIFSEPWDRNQLVAQVFLISLLVYAFVILCAAHSRQLRYAFPLVPLTIVWTARGLLAIHDWARNTVQRSFVWDSFKNWAATLLTSSALLVLVTISALGVRQVAEFSMGSSRYSYIRSAGLWLKEHEPGRKNILSEAAVFPFYAGGYQILAPVASEEVVLRYLHSENPDFIVLGSSPVKSVSYLRDWYDHGIPDPRAKLIHSEGTGTDRILIYKWDHVSSSQPATE